MWVCECVMCLPCCSSADDFPWGPDWGCYLGLAKFHQDFLEKKETKCSKAVHMDMYFASLRGDFWLPYPYFRLIDNIGSLQGNGAQVEVAPGPEGCHHIGDNDIECLIIAGIHEEVCSAARGPQGLSPHTFIINTTITIISWTDKETRWTGRGEKAQNLLLFWELEIFSVALWPTIFFHLDEICLHTNTMCHTYSLHIQFNQLTQRQSLCVHVVPTHE